MAGDIRDLADEEVMQLVQRGDPRAFELLYDRHGGAAYSLAYRIVGRQAAAEDVVQEALISIWRSRLRYDQTRGSVRTWILGIVRNRAIDGLPEKLRVVIVLAAIEGHDIREVARLLDVPEGTVKSRLFLARKGLAESLRCLAPESTTD